MHPAKVPLWPSVATLRLFAGSLLSGRVAVYPERSEEWHSSGRRSLLCSLLLGALISTKTIAQVSDTVRADTVTKTMFAELATSDQHPRKRFDPKHLISDPYYYSLTPRQKKQRIWIVGGANVVGYSATMIGLYNAWYKDYPQTGFHTFNDWPEWQQVDKVGHLYSAYIESRLSMEMWRWTGIDRKKRIWIGGMSGAIYQTAIEMLDGFSEGWGWSWPDFGANILGSGALVAQELAWNDQRIKLKFSFHNKSYDDPQLAQRSRDLFGKSTAQRLIKDYNGQTYWASANLRSFFPSSKLPPWLCVSVGYGAEGMFGGRQNIAKDEDGTITFHRPDVKRYRQWYLAPDVDLTKIKTNKKALKVLFTALSVFKFPTPALEFSNGKLKAHAIYF